MDFYPYNHDHLELRDGVHAVLRQPTMGHLCGYTSIPSAKLPKEWHGNYDGPGLQYLAVHGGITYCETQGAYVVFGFDCAHHGDDQVEELGDPKYILELAKQMHDQILALAEKYSRWRDLDFEGRCALIDEVRGAAKTPVEFGFGAMIGMMAGGRGIKDAEGEETNPFMKIAPATFDACHITNKDE